MDLNRPKKQLHLQKRPPRKRNENIASDLPQNKDPFFAWEAPEYEHFEKSPKWYWLTGGILFAIVVYALATNSILMAITFILIGMLGYVFSERHPRTIQMEINADGIRADNYFYEYDDLKSFWIFYDAEENFKILSLHSKKTFLPHIQIPIGEANPILIREALVHYLPEIRQELTIIDKLEKLIGL